jgi:hypothetical protein
MRLEASRLFECVAHPNWSVEWNLPRWLGEYANLPSTVIRDLVRANAIGLVFVKLKDDRMDGELDKRALDDAIHLERLLLKRARSTFSHLVDDAAQLDRSIDAHLKHWNDAGRSSAAFAGFDLHDLRPLADEGAPLFIVVEVINAIRSNSPIDDRIRASIHHYLVAAVLYDHLKDWRTDLTGGRKNYFISAMLGNNAPGDMDTTLEREVNSVMLHGVKLEQYINLITESLALGVESARACGLMRFAQHLAALGEEAHSGGEQLLRGMQTMLNQATLLIETG